MRELIDYISFPPCRRRKTTPTTSRGQWMPLWFGRKLSGARFAKSNRTCTTPRSLSGWANAGRRCRRRSGLRTLPKLSDCVNCTCKSTPTTSTGPARRPSWAPAAAPAHLRPRRRPRPLVRWAIRAVIATAAAVVAWALKVWAIIGGAWRLKAGPAPWSLRARAARCWRHTTTTATVHPTRMAGSPRWPKWRLRHRRGHGSRKRWADSRPSTTIASSCASQSTASSRRASATAKTSRRRCWPSAPTVPAAIRRQRWRRCRRPKYRPAHRRTFPIRRRVWPCTKSRRLPTLP